MRWKYGLRILLYKNKKTKLPSPKTPAKGCKKKKETKEFAKKNGITSIRECSVYPKPNKSPHRILIEFSKTENKKIKKESLVIEKYGRHNYSEDYKKLTREFYTIFD